MRGIQGSFQLNVLSAMFSNLVRSVSVEKTNGCVKNFLCFVYLAKFEQLKTNDLFNFIRHIEFFKFQTNTKYINSDCFMSDYFLSSFGHIILTELNKNPTENHFRTIYEPVTINRSSCRVQQTIRQSSCMTPRSILPTAFLVHDVSCPEGTPVLVLIGVPLPFPLPLEGTWDQRQGHNPPVDGQTK